MADMNTPFPILLKEPATPLSMEERDAKLRAACEMAMEILRSRGITVPADTEEEPLPASTVELIRRLPRS